MLTGIYAILDSAFAGDLESLCDSVLSAGVRVVQYRAKDGVDRGLLRRLYKRTSAAGAMLIVNDDVSAARDCDGVHLGREDLAAAGDVRRKLGSAILGLSAGTLAELTLALPFAPDYIGAGPFRPTTTKLDAGEAIGPSGLRAVTHATTTPVAAIGGIVLEDLPTLHACGARMVALVSAIALSTDPAETTAHFVSRWAALES